jgi:hypothetical protein
MKQLWLQVAVAAAAIIIVAVKLYGRFRKNNAIQTVQS